MKYAMKKALLTQIIIVIALLTEAQTYDSIPHHGVNAYSQPQNIAELHDGSILGGIALVDYDGSSLIPIGFLLHKVSREGMEIVDSIILDGYEHLPWHLFARNPKGKGNICAKMGNHEGKRYSTLKICRFDDNLNFDFPNEITVLLMDDYIAGFVPGLIVNPDGDLVINYCDLDDYGGVNNTYFMNVDIDGIVKQQKSFDNQLMPMAYAYGTHYGPKVFRESPLQYCCWSKNWEDSSSIKLNCFVLDSVFNIVETYWIDDIIVIPDNQYLAMRYSWNEQILGLDGDDFLLAAGYVAMGWPQNQYDKGVAVIKFDKVLNVKKAVKFLSEPVLENGHGNRPIGLEKGHDGSIYFSYITNDPFSQRENYYGRVAVVKMDQDLNIIWQRYCLEPTGYGRERGFMTILDDNSVAIIGNNMNCPEVFYIIVHDNGTIDTPEMEASIRPYLFYPNPAQDQLHLQYSPDVKPKTIELYDLQGRLVCTQSHGLESVDMQGLAPGQYLMKVTLEDGKSYTDKVMKE
jgi:hypothetical protein